MPRLSAYCYHVSGSLIRSTQSLSRRDWRTPVHCGRQLCLIHYSLDELPHQRPNAFSLAQPLVVQSRPYHPTANRELREMGYTPKTVLETIAPVSFGWRSEDRFWDRHMHAFISVNQFCNAQIRRHT